MSVTSLTRRIMFQNLNILKYYLSELSALRRLALEIRFVIAINQSNYTTNKAYQSNNDDSATKHLIFVYLKIIILTFQCLIPYRPGFSDDFQNFWGLSFKDKPQNSIVYHIFWELYHKLRHCLIFLWDIFWDFCEILCEISPSKTHGEASRRYPTWGIETQLPKNALWYVILPPLLLVN